MITMYYVLRKRKRRGGKMISLILAIIIVNVLQKLLMALVGANVMFFSIKSKLIWYVVVWFLLLGLLGV